MRWTIVLFALGLTASCGGSEAVPLCRSGTTLAPDGHCYTDDVPTIVDALLALDVCAPLAARGEIDVDGGCASGVCAGMSYADINEVLLQDGECVTSSTSAVRVYCTWAIGMDGFFVDNDQDQIPDPGAATSRIHLFPPYTGALHQGAGVGTAASCFVEELGAPDWLVFQDVDGRLVVREMSYDAHGLLLFDRGNDDGTGVPDGLIDELYVYGAPAE